MLDLAADLIPNENTSLEMLSLQLVTSLKLVTEQGMQTLSLIEIPNILSQDTDQNSR